jgi:hypothetical protein
MAAAMHGKPGPVIGAIHEVRATFSSPEAMQDGVDRLELPGFDRADLSLPEVTPSADEATLESGVKVADPEADARQARTLHTSGAGTVALWPPRDPMIATGGGAAPAVPVAAVGAGAVGGAVQH